MEWILGGIALLLIAALMFVYLWFFLTLGGLVVLFYHPLIGVGMIGAGLLLKATQ